MEGAGVKHKSLYYVTKLSPIFMLYVQCIFYIIITVCVSLLHVKLAY